MTHHINGFIGKEKELKQAASRYASAKVARLKHDYGFLVLSEELYDEVCNRRRVNVQNKLGLLLSKTAPVVYVETDYFGGGGTQTASWYRDGKVRHYRERFGGAIDKALAEIGVQCDGDKDEFDTLGLGKHRLNEDWLEIAECCNDYVDEDLCPCGRGKQQPGLPAPACKYCWPPLDEPLDFQI